MGVSRNAVPPAEAVRLRRRGTLQRSALTRNLAQSTKWVRSSRRVLGLGFHRAACRESFQYASFSKTGSRLDVERLDLLGFSQS